MSNSFRADVEGLRAVAVLPVVAFHLNPHLIPGGFIGVDLFFVISGYVITRMIMAQGDAFTFTGFYKRRIFRLFPALLVTCLGCLIAGWQLMPPNDYRDLAHSALATMFAVSNIYFFWTLDYFSNANVYHPLLHTWSLGVEEQFYLFWPILIVAALRWRRLALICAIAFMAGLTLVVVPLPGTDPTFSFYMTPTRVFQFAAGALVVAWEDKWTRNIPRPVSTAMAALALLALVASFWMFDEQTAWPGLSSLLPTLAIAALILAGRNPLTEPVLASSPFRYIGRISYSLYLVHWPVVVFHRYTNVVAPTTDQMWGLLAIMIILAALMYALVERPFRHQPLAPTTPERTGQSEPATSPRWPIFITSTVARPAAIASLAGLLAIAGLAISISGGLPQRLAKSTVQHSDKGLTFAGDACSFKTDRCQFGDRSAARVVYLLGDSHALNWIHGLDEVFRAARIKGIAYYDHGCLFLPGVRMLTAGRVDTKCEETVAAAYAHVAKTDAPVILAMSYQGYRQNAIGSSPSASPAKTNKQYYRWLADRLADALGRLTTGARKIVIVRQAYNTGIDLPRCLFNPAQTKSPDLACPAWSLERVARWTRNSDRLIDDLTKRHPHVHVIDPKRHFCREPKCRTTDGKDLFFRDKDHLTNSGSAFLANAVRDDLLRYLGGSD